MPIVDHVDDDILAAQRSWALPVQAIFAEVNQAITGEVQGMRDALSQVRTLMGEAIAGLNASFEGLHTQSQQQASLVRALVESLGTSSYIHNNSYLNVQEFVKKTSEVIKSYVDFAEILSAQSHKLVQDINGVAKRLDSISGTLTDTHRGASARPVTVPLYDLNQVSTAVHRLEQHSQTFREQIHSQVSKAETMLTAIGHLIETDVIPDMSLAMAVKQRVDAILVELNTANLPVVQSLQEVSALAEQIKGSVALAVRSLQFEDLVGQLLSYMEVRLNRMECFATTLHECDQPLAAASPESVDALHCLQATLTSLRSSWQQEEHKSVLQGSMDEGEIELF